MLVRHTSQTHPVKQLLTKVRTTVLPQDPNAKVEHVDGLVLEERLVKLTEIEKVVHDPPLPARRRRRPKMRRARRAAPRGRR